MIRSFHVVLDTELENEHVGQLDFVITVDHDLSSSQATKIGNVFYPSRRCYVAKLEEL